MAVLMRHKTNVYGLVDDLTTLTNSINAETTRATTVEGALASLTTTDKTNLVAAINEVAASAATGSSDVQAALDAEITRALTAEADLQAQITSNDEDIAAEITRATTAEAGIAADLDAEITRATTAEAGISADLATEVTRATTAEADLQAQITSNDGDIAAEITRATTAEADLQGQIDALGTASTDGLDAEITRATTAEADLQAQIDAEKTLSLQVANNLSDVADAAAARTNLDVYSTSEVTSAIDAAKLALGTNHSVADIAARDALTGLTIGDNVYVSNDGDTKWAIYKVISDAPVAFEKIMDEDVFTNAISAEAVKTTYESNADTNAFTDEAEARVERLGDATTVLDTTAQEVFAAINELNSGLSASSGDIQAELDATQVGAGLGTDGAYSTNGTANYISTATSLADADNKLDAAIKTESDRATATEAAISADLDAEITRATTAEAGISADLATEVTRATTAEADLQSQIDSLETASTDGLDAEITRATTAEAALASDIADLDSVTLKIANNLSDLADVSTARTNLDVYSTSEVDEAIRLGGAIFITETLTVSSDKITLTNEPKNGVVFNYATVRHVDANFVSYDIPVTSDGTATGFNLSPDSAGQFDSKTVTVQYAYIPVS